MDDVFVKHLRKSKEGSAAMRFVLSCCRFAAFIHEEEAPNEQFFRPILNFAGFSPIRRDRPVRHHRIRSLPASVTEAVPTTIHTIVRVQAERRRARARIAVP
jgi:hypothetical protein